MSHNNSWLQKDRPRSEVRTGRLTLCWTLQSKHVSTSLTTTRTTTNTHLLISLQSFQKLTAHAQSHRRCSSFNLELRGEYSNVFLLTDDQKQSNVPPPLLCPLTSLCVCCFGINTDADNAVAFCFFFSVSDMTEQEGDSFNRLLANGNSLVKNLNKRLFICCVVSLFRLSLCVEPQLQPVSSSFITTLCRLRSHSCHTI